MDNFITDIKNKLNLSSEQLEGFKFLYDYWFSNYSSYPNEYLAYCLATAYYETAYTMKPIKEYRAKPNTKVRALQDRYWNTGFYGRGYVQLTWEANYLKASHRLGIDLISNPDKVLEPNIAANILFKGMIEGWFTGKKLSDYKSDFIEARKIINGMDQASTIARYARCILTSLNTVSNYAKCLIAAEDVKQFQLDNDLIADGIIGYNTWNKLIKV